jgi:hypothetical protein
MVQRNSTDDEDEAVAHDIRMEGKDSDVGEDDETVKISLSAPCVDFTFDISQDLVVTLQGIPPSR